MKKLFFLFTLSFSLMGAFAQTGGQTNVTDTSCFCCNGFYALPNPVIMGPATVDCGQKPVYSIKACPGATITWSVTAPNTIASGQGTSSITLAPVTGTGYSVAVQIRCGNKVVETKIPVKVNVIQNCTANFLATITMLPGGFLNINTVPDTKAGAEHWWGIVYNGTYPNCTIPCVSIPFASVTTGACFGGVHETATGAFSQVGMGTGVTAGTSGYGVNYSGFPNNSCFKITHYINCCGTWYKQTQCVSMGSSAAKGVAGGSAVPYITKSEVEEVSKKELPKELQRD